MAAALAVVMVALPGARPARAECASGRHVVGYFTSWGIYARDFHVADMDASKLTHVNYAFANIDGATLTAVLGDPWADVDRPYPGDCTGPGCLRGNFRRIELLKQAHPDLEVLISIGGWTWSEHFSDAALTAASRQRFARSAVDLFIKGEFGDPWGTHPGIFDGIDIDWEFPVSGGLVAGRPEDRANFTLLLEEIRAQLDALSLVTGRPYRLTIASGAPPARIANLEMDRVAAACDFVNIMAYDFHGPWDPVTGFNAPLFESSADPGPDPASFNAAASLANHVAAGCPPGKLVLGVPFYGRTWSGVTDAGNGLYQRASGAGPGTWEPGNVDYWDVVAGYLPSFSRFQHAEARVPWLFDGTTFVSYDDPASLRAKAEHVVARGHGGVMAWELSGDLHGVPAPPDSLLAALHDVTCAVVELPGRIDDLRVARVAGDLRFTWTEDPRATGGHHLYQTDVVTEAGGLRASAGHAPFLAPPAGTALPVTFADGVRLGLAFYQVLGVSGDGAEGPN